FLELETRGDRESFVEAVAALGCEYALTSERRLKLILQNGVEIRDLYRIAAEQQVQIRRLNFKRDSLEDIFLKAMEDNNGADMQAPTAPNSVAHAGFGNDGRR